MRYAVEALGQLGDHVYLTSTFVGDLGALAGFAVVALVLATVTMPRATR